MSKMTHWERSMQKSGYQIIDFTHEEIVEHLLQVFRRDEAHLLTLVASDETNRRKLICVLDYASLGDQSTIFGGTIVYNKKERRFTHIMYSDKHNWAVIFSIESKATFFAWEFYQSVKNFFPYGYSVRKLTEWIKKN